jgi:hypothetical protein
MRRFERLSYGRCVGLPGTLSRSKLIFPSRRVLKTRDDADLYRLQAEKLSRTVKVLQDDLAVRNPGAQAARAMSEQEESIGQIIEEFQKKSEEAGGLAKTCRSVREIVLT